MENDEQQQQMKRKMEEELRSASPNCPRCSSGCTKFAYFNNHSITQPRYFCRNCRRHWTKGGIIRGALGGSCTKRSKTKASPLPSAASLCAADLDFEAYASAPLRVPHLMPETIEDLEVMNLHPLLHDMIMGSMEASADAPPPAPGSQPARHYYGLTIDELMLEPEFMASINPDLQGTPRDQYWMTDDVPTTPPAAAFASSSGVSNIKEVEEEEEEEDEVIVKNSTPK